MYGSVGAPAEQSPGPPGQEHQTLISRTILTRRAEASGASIWSNIQNLLQLSRLCAGLPREALAALVRKLNRKGSSPAGMTGKNGEKKKRPALSRAFVILYPLLQLGYRIGSGGLPCGSHLLVPVGHGAIIGLWNRVVKRKYSTRTKPQFRWPESLTLSHETADISVSRTDLS
jgi:hypothetical protein